MKIGIWGGGFIGSNLAARLISRGVDTCILGRGGASDSIAAEKGSTFRQMTFSSTQADMEQALSGVSTLVHCAGSAVDGYEEYFSATVRMARAAVTAKLERVILLSTVAVYGAALPKDDSATASIVSKSVTPLPLTPYARSRYQTEIETRRILREGGVELTVVRIPMAVGRGMNARVFRKLAFILKIGFFPRFSAQPALLPCIGIRRLSECLVYLAIIPKGVEPLYQFADSVAWLDIVDLFKRQMGRHVFVLQLPGKWLRLYASYGRGRRISKMLAALMNFVQYEDDSDLILGEAEARHLTTWGCVEQSMLELVNT